MSEVEIVTRRRKWSTEEKAALLAEIEAEGGRVTVVARRHGISESLLYNWRAAWKMAASMRMGEPVEFMPVGILGRGTDEEPKLLAGPEQATTTGGHQDVRTGRIEIELLNGARIRVDSDVSERALRRVLQAMKGAL